MIETSVTDNGYFEIQHGTSTDSDRGTVGLWGTDGGATYAVGFYDSAGTFHAYTDGALTVDNQIHVEHGKNIRLVVYVTGGTSISATIGYSPSE